jgi:hypothetical protein
MRYCSNWLLLLVPLLRVAPVFACTGSPAPVFNVQFFRGKLALEPRRISYFRVLKSIG